MRKETQGACASSEHHGYSSIVIGVLVLSGLVGGKPLCWACCGTGVDMLVLLCMLEVLYVRFVSQLFERISPDRHEIFDKVKASANFVLDDDRTWTWLYVSASRLLQLTLSRCDRLQDMFAAALAAHPCSELHPWRISEGTKRTLYTLTPYNLQRFTKPL